MTSAQKVLPIALSLVALATVGTAPAPARAIHQPATQDSQQMYMYTGPDAAWSWPEDFLYQRDERLLLLRSLTGGGRIGFVVCGPGGRCRQYRFVEGHNYSLSSSA